MPFILTAASLSCGLSDLLRGLIFGFLPQKLLVGYSRWGAASGSPGALSPGFQPTFCFSPFASVLLSVVPGTTGTYIVRGSCVPVT